MEFLRRITKPVSLTLSAAVLGLSLQMPLAQAAMVPTESVVHSLQAQQDIERIHEALGRDEVKAQLAELGVDPAQVAARVDALSDDEARQLAEQLDQMPAGSGVVGALLFVFVLLVVTDLLGLTNVFPFTKKGALR